MDTVIGAFAGAFFAFIFLRLGDFLSKLYTREVKHYNSLVNLATQLNEIGGVVHDNIYILPSFRQVISSGNVYYNNLHLIKIDKSHYENLYDIDLINDLFTYFYQVRKINDDMETATNGYSDLKNSLMQNNMNLEHYKVNAQLLSDNLKIIEKFLIDLEDRTIKLQAQVRIQLKKDKPLGTKIMEKLIRPSAKKLKKSEIDKEYELLKKEIEESKTKSQKEIEEIVKKLKND